MRWIIGAILLAGVVVVFIVYPFCKLLAQLDEEEEQRHQAEFDNWGMG